MKQRCCKNPFFWLGIAAFCLSGTTVAEESEIPPEENLARCHFHLAAFDQLGAKLLTATGDYCQLWDVDTGQEEIRLVGHGADIHSASFSPDGREILTSSGNAGVVGPNDYTVRIWDIKSGEQKAELLANDTYVTAACYSPSGKQILGVCRSNRGRDSAILWDLDTKERALVLSAFETYSPDVKMVDPLIFSPSGHALLGLADEGHEIKLWNSKTSEEMWVIERWERGPLRENRIGFGGLSFSPDGKLILAVCSDYRARTWFAENGADANGFYGHEAPLRTAAFCFGGEKVLTASHDGSVRLWNARTGREEKRFDHEGKVAGASISGDNARILSTYFKPHEDEKIQDKHWFGVLWDVKTGQKIRELDFGTRMLPPLLFTPDGKKFIGLLKPGQTALFDSQTGEVVREYK